MLVAMQLLLYIMYSYHAEMVVMWLEYKMYFNNVDLFSGSYLQQSLAGNIGPIGRAHTNNWCPANAITINLIMKLRSSLPRSYSYYSYIATIKLVYNIFFEY